MKQACCRIPGRGPTTNLCYITYSFCEKNISDLVVVKTGVLWLLEMHQQRRHIHQDSTITPSNAINGSGSCCNVQHIAKEETRDLDCP